jgi:hypothetical protein
MKYFISYIMCVILLRSAKIYFSGQWELSMMITSQDVHLGE